MGLTLNPKIVDLTRQDAPADRELPEVGAAGGGLSASFFGGLMFLGTFTLVGPVKIYNGLWWVTLGFL